MYNEKLWKIKKSKLRRKIISHFTWVVERLLIFFTYIPWKRKFVKIFKYWKYENTNTIPPADYFPPPSPSPADVSPACWPCVRSHCRWTHTSRCRCARTPAAPRWWTLSGGWTWCLVASGPAHWVFNTIIRRDRRLKDTMLTNLPVPFASATQIHVYLPWRLFSIVS